MAYIVMFVLDDTAHLEKVLQLLSDSGIRGATIMESTGLYRHQKKVIPMRYLYADPSVDEKDNATIFMIVPDRDKALHVCELLESVMGDFNKPNTGVFAAWPLELVKGVDRQEYQEKGID